MKHPLLWYYIGDPNVSYFGQKDFRSISKKIQWDKWDSYNAQEGEFNVCIWIWVKHDDSADIWRIIVKLCNSHASKDGATIAIRAEKGLWDESNL